MQDFLLDSDLDLKLNADNSDVVMGESGAQHQQLLLITVKSAWKENLDKGVGVLNYLESEDTAGLMREVRQQFTSDGIKISTLKITGGKLIIDATY